MSLEGPSRIPGARRSPELRSRIFATSSNFALFDGLPVRTDSGMVDSGGRIVGVGSGSVAVKVKVVEVSRGASTDEKVVCMTELARVEKRVLVSVFDVTVDDGDSAAVDLRLVTEDVQDADPAVIDLVSPAAPGTGSESSDTFGHNFATASPENSIPINVPGCVIVPLQAWLTRMVSFSRNSMQSDEQALPLIKSVAAQPVRGVL
ncbi:hypothetical protein MMC07_008093 [Pseudocyphellaria aurata]|nr:hypothetical protein [Pseudocyphellaria aurata]